MHYIVYDLEFNQDLASSNPTETEKPRCPFEIIQIGAIKLDSELNTVAEFNRYVRPIIYPEISPFITELTGITTEQLEHESTFPEVFPDFLEFIGSSDSIWCTWGKTDLKELFRNVSYHQLNRDSLPKYYINLQTHASLHFKLSPKKLLKLQSTVEALAIPQTHPYHDALNDAYYTAEIMKKIYTSDMKAKIYDPEVINIRSNHRQPKRSINYEGLFHQFEKMYERPITEEEKEMIKLAFHMGKTGQFIR